MDYDSGAVAIDGTFEKIITEIAKHLVDLLRSGGIKPKQQQI